MASSLPLSLLRTNKANDEEDTNSENGDAAAAFALAFADDTTDPPPVSSSFSSNGMIVADRSSSSSTMDGPPYFQGDISSEDMGNNDHDEEDIPFCVPTSMHGVGSSSSSNHGVYSYRQLNNDASSTTTDGMIMYMDGFRVSLKGGQPCLNLFFDSWTLDSYHKFLFAMVLIVLLAILTEAISKLRFMMVRVQKQRQQRHWQSSQSRQRRRQCNVNNTTSGRLLMTLLHGLQALVGYLLMLATMTFSLELFLCVILGLALGYALCYDDDDTHVTTNPCCNYMQDEANERNETVALAAAATAAALVQEEEAAAAAAAQQAEEEEEEARRKRQDPARTDEIAKNRTQPEEIQDEERAELL